MKYLADGLAVACYGAVNELRDEQLTITARHHQTHRVETNGHFHVDSSNRWHSTNCAYTQPDVQK